MFIEVDSGEHITYYAERLIVNAKNYNMPIQGNFNGISLIVHPNSSIREIQYLYDLKMYKQKYEGK